LQRVRSAPLLPLASNVGSLQRNGKKAFESVLAGPISENEASWCACQSRTDDAFPHGHSRSGPRWSPGAVI